MNYDAVKKWVKLSKVLKQILDGNVFVEIKVGIEDIGGTNIRMKGNMIYSNIDGIPAVDWQVPDAIMTKAQQLYDWLIEKIQEEVLLP